MKFEERPINSEYPIATGLGMKNGYSNATSEFSSFPSQNAGRTKHQFTNKPDYTDSLTTFQLGKNPHKEVNMDMFTATEREVRIEQRLINKVCADSELSNLVLNLYKYKQFYRNNRVEELKKQENSKSFTHNHLYPKHVKVMRDEPDLIAQVRKTQEERDKYKKEVGELREKVKIMEKLHKTFIEKCKNLELEKQVLEKQVKQGIDLDKIAKGRVEIVNF